MTIHAPNPDLSPGNAHVCFILRTRRRVIHWHWPRADIVN